MKKILLLLLVVLMVLFSGCVSLSYDVKVDKNGELEKYNMTINTSSMVYSMLNSVSMEEGGKSLRDTIIAQGGTYEEIWNEDSVQIKTSGIRSDNVTIEKTDDYIIYRDSFDSSSEDSEYEFDGAIKYHYYLEMPNKIIESNADSVKGKKAEWHMTNSSSVRDIYAKCETPSLPGIGLFGVVFMILIITILERKK